MKFMVKIHVFKLGYRLIQINNLTGGWRQEANERKCFLVCYTDAHNAQFILKDDGYVCGNGLCECLPVCVYMCNWVFVTYDFSFGSSLSINCLKCQREAIFPLTTVVQIQSSPCWQINILSSASFILLSVFPCSRCTLSSWNCCHSFSSPFFFF